jgi:hypothetical protein
MRSIWVRAGLGALAVFALGMMFYTAVRTTRGRAKEALLAIKAELDSVSVDAADRAVPFVLDGHVLGRFTGLTLSPARGAAGLSALVTLDRLDVPMLSGCDLVPIEPEHFEMAQGFRCATPADRALRTVGQVRFEPVGVVRPVRGDKAVLEQLQEYGAVTVDSAHPGTLHANMTGDSGELVNIQADSNGAYIHVKDGKGKVVLVRADKRGLVVKVDSNTTR